MHKNKDNIKLCRVCLQTDNYECKSLFTIYKNKNIFEHINEISGILINENDGLPDTICSTCLAELDACIIFKNKCQFSNDILNKSINGIDCIKIIKKEEIDDEYQLDDSILDSAPLENNIIATEISKREINTVETPKCDDCGQTFKTKCKLRVHWKSRHVKKPRKCSICKRIFKTNYSFVKHRKETSGPCFDLSSGIDIKVEGEGKSRMFLCKYCDYKCKIMSVIRNHLITHTGERSYQCDICNKSFTRHSTLTTHRQIVHFKGTCMKECHVCGKLYSGLRRLKKHLKIHSEIMLQCDICKIFVKSKQSLVTHMLRHEGTKTYTCELCAASFYTSPELTNHRKRAHATKETFVKCDFCEFTAPKAKVLSHTKQHNSAHKPYNCVNCGKFFATVQKLTHHESIHKDVKKYICPICPQRFFRKDSIRKHVSSKHNTSMTALRNSGSLMVKQKLDEDEQL